MTCCLKQIKIIINDYLTNYVTYFQEIYVHHRTKNSIISMGLFYRYTSAFITSDKLNKQMYYQTFYSIYFLSV